MLDNDADHHIDVNANANRNPDTVSATGEGGSIEQETRCARHAGAESAPANYFEPSASPSAVLFQLWCGD